MTGALRPEAVRPWGTVAGLAILMAYADGFWLTALRGAVGAIERTQHPFEGWLRDSTLLVPPFVLAVLAALALARRRYGPRPRTLRATVVTALLVALAGTVLGVAAAAANAAGDYRLQAQRLSATSPAHHPATDGEHVHDAGCGDDCAAALRETRAVHLRAVADAGAVLVATNLVIVGWVVAARGGHLDGPDGFTSKPLP